MLTGLDIRDVVLIDQLALQCGAGLTVLTGETGAGKSILLDALGLALGARAEAGLVRKGCAQAVVTASFEVPPGHAVYALLKEQGLTPEDDALILRRVLGADGRSRAFINDQAVSVSLQRQIGTLLVEIHGQFETQGLLDASTHRALLDAFGGLGETRRQVAAAWQGWRETQARLEKAKADMDQAAREEDWLRHVVTELERLAPQAGEEESLSDIRGRLMNREKFTEAATAALSCLEGERGVETLLARAQAVLEKTAVKTGPAFDNVIDTLDRAASEIAEAVAQLQSLGSDADRGGQSLEDIEDRLYALRDLARKHNCTVDELPARLDELAAKLALIDGRSQTLGALEAAAMQARQAYLALAEKLSAARKKAAKKIDQAVMAELPPLRLEKAKFETLVATAAAESGWGPEGVDSVVFAVATNPGADPGPLSKIASGGELARFTLALKVVLAKSDAPPVLVFDEVDTGIGGAVSDAVGERLARLGRDFQVFCVTHSPQVAARADSHFVVSKQEKDGKTATRVTHLRPEERLEEIARMLSGAKITAEARAAAARLMENREHAAA